MQAAVIHRQMDASFSWDDFNWLRKLWTRKLLVKDILRPDDALAGADGVILSNHGGRQLDAAVSPLDVLGESRARISAPILIDSGYRRGRLERNKLEAGQGPEGGRHVFRRPDGGE